MCAGCYAEEGSPQPNGFATNNLALWLMLAEYDPALHILVDDWNCSDNDLAFLETQDVGDIGRFALERAKQVSESQRFAALALAQGISGTERIVRLN